MISGRDIKLSLGTLQIARENWDLKTFARNTFGDDYEFENEGRQAYLKGKYEAFCADPLKFYFTLDLAVQACITKHLKKLVARVSV